MLSNWPLNDAKPLQLLEKGPKCPIWGTKAMKILFLIFFSTIAGWISGCGQNEKAISGKAPEIQLPNYQGQTKNYPYQDKVTLLVFWATWCQPCLMEIPSLNSLQEKCGEKFSGGLG